MRNVILSLTEKVIERLQEKNDSVDSKTITFEVEVPKSSEYGDYSVNLAFKLSKIFRKAPLKIAEEIKPLFEEVIASKFSRDIKEVQVANPGFLNFFLTKNKLESILKEIHTVGENFGNNESGKGQKVLLEFVSANPTGPLTIAHGRQACVGDSLARIMLKSGYDVQKEFYLNDGGNQIHTLGMSVYLRCMELIGNEIIFPEDCYQGSYIKDIAQEIIDQDGAVSVIEITDGNYERYATYAADKILAEIKEDLKDISVSFDQYYSESTLYADKIQKVLDLLEKKGLSFEKDGALWFRTTDLGDDKDRVLIKTDKSFTYLVPDIAYHKDKFDRGFTRVIDFLGPDHHGYIPRLKASVQAVGYDPNQLEVVIVQLTTLYKNGEPFRMSTRKGNFISLRELMDEVGADAARLFFLMKLTDSQLEFDLTLAKEKSQDNPVYYFQYAYARICSILRLSEIDSFTNANLGLLETEEETDLIKYMNEYAHTLSIASKTLQPYRVVDYLKELASLFHRYYNAHRVITDDEELSKARLYLVSCVREVIASGLSLLGVHCPERM